ncbi:MAG: murein L,D-transpeptidase family protein [Pseudobdellovibrionaceae bacterium]
MRSKPALRVSLFVICLSFLAACAGYEPEWPNLWMKERTRIIGRVAGEFKNRNFELGTPVYIRIFKQSAIAQLWLRDSETGMYMLYKTYPICAFSGDLGPKQREGDQQSPEGFYAVGPGQMNPASKYHLAFNIGYPNPFDRYYHRTGSALMVHGGCKSVGCYAMTDKQIEEIYAIVSLAHDHGQRYVPVHIFPFHMTEENMLAHASSPWYPFWRNLQQGYLRFEETKIPPVVSVQNGVYVFDQPSGT